MKRLKSNRLRHLSHGAFTPNPKMEKLVAEMHADALTTPTEVLSLSPLIAWYPWHGPAPFVKTKIGRATVVATIPGSVLVSF